MCDEIIEKIREKIGGYIYSTQSLNLEQTVVKLLREKGKNIALAESCTGGYIAKRITDVPGSSEVFEYGIVSYSNDVKMKLLGVRSETIEQYTEVSEQTAAEMAEGVRRLSGADIGISVTGISGPGGGTEDKPVGLAYIGFSHADGTHVCEVRTGKKQDSREYNRYVTASKALHAVIQYFQERDE